MTTTAWPEVPLGELAGSIEYGVTASASREPVGPQFLRITDIQDGKVDWRTVPWCECDQRSSDRARLEPGDIVFARTGATTGKSFYIDDCPANAVFASYLIRVRVSGDTDPRFVARFFETPQYWAQITSDARGAAQAGVNATVLKGLAIPVPPIEEQRRIAAVLDKADELRAKRRAALAQLDTLTESIFLDLFPIGGPDRGLRGTLAQVSDVQVGYPFKSDLYDTSGSGTRLCRGANVLPGRLDWRDLRRYPDDQLRGLGGFELQPNDVVIAMDRPWINEGFKIAMTQPDDAGALLVQRVARLRAGDRVTGSFLYWRLLQKDFERYCRPTETTIPHISPLEIRNFEIALPGPTALAKFTAAADRIDILRREHEAAVEFLEYLFASLQQRAFRGEL